MDAAIQALEPKIRQILSAPGIDLATISAKRVRKQLLELDPSLSPEFVKTQKDSIDEVIARVYEEISSAHQADDDDEPHGTKRKASDASPGASSAPTKKAKKTKTKQELADEELARQLQSEYNRGARGSRAAATKPNGTKKTRKAKKSSATVDSDDDGDDGAAKPKKKRSGGGGGGFKKEYLLSEPLGNLLQSEKLARTQVVKLLWDHIKANNMQNPSNKREIVCDDAFRAIFKCDRIDMFKMNKELGQHLYEAQTEAAS